MPEEVKTICPNCGGRMVGAEAEYYRCPSCGYERKSATLDLGSLALGAIVGGGAAALWFLLTRE
ncbi:hypothetical protein AKJ57_00650 [candidate division MSBL1 archaeon SCGC-AAA259A05]|uniref:Uncharacterized protein n=1 Tax=candidate division MSBL1 archaeon SCGC-AAA259A05 TaxID=1698259 RepID=A0A133UBK3_9EURY|nr:hypothetical protein AKJ57_00650 [candidate division MSBL1 archaeon SCGC-AAA259A05]